jgi:predicted metal-dependent hydrolase
MKQSKNISGDERGDFKVAKVNLPLSDRRLRLFLEGKEDWLEEGLLAPEEKIKEKDCRRRFFHGPRRRCATKLCATIWRNSGTAELQQNVVIIGGYAARNMQIIAAIQTNANQMGEGNANIAYVLGHLHLAPSDNS